MFLIPSLIESTIRAPSVPSSILFHFLVVQVDTYGVVVVLWSFLFLFFSVFCCLCLLGFISIPTSLVLFYFFVFFLKNVLVYWQSTEFRVWMKLKFADHWGPGLYHIWDWGLWGGRPIYEISVVSNFNGSLWSHWVQFELSGGLSTRTGSRFCLEVRKSDLTLI